MRSEGLEAVAKRLWTTRRLRKMRLAYLADHPFCALCAVRGRVSAAEEIHHIYEQNRWKDLIERYEYWLEVCKRCHGYLTWGGRRKKRVGPAGRLY